MTIILPPKIDKRKIYNPEKMEKLRLGRIAYWEKQKALKALLPKVEKKVRDLSESVYAMANDQSNDDDLPTTKFIDSSITRQHVLKKINTKRDKILQAQIDEATGLYYTTEDGKHVYQKRPDGSRGEFLLNQLIGKPTESMEIKQITKIQVDI